MRDLWWTLLHNLFMTLEIPVILRQIESMWRLHLRFSFIRIPRYLNDDTRLIVELLIERLKLYELSIAVPGLMSIYFVLSALSVNLLLESQFAIV